MTSKPDQEMVALLSMKYNQDVNIIEKIDPDLKGTGIGFNNAIGFLCSAIGPIVISFLGEIDTFLPFHLINGLVVITFFITLKLVKK